MSDAKQRAKQLKDELGIDLYARYPLEVMERQMDRPPDSEEERKGWRSIELEETRIYAGIIRFSWCFPICYRYAVLLLDGQIVYGDDEEPVPLRQERLAEILGMKQQNFNAGLKRLIAKKYVRLEGPRMYAFPKPAKLTREERKNICTDVFSKTGEPGLPTPFLNLLNNLAASGASEDICTDVRAQGLKICRNFNEELSKLRAAKTQGFKDLCTQAQELCTNAAAPSTPPRSAGVLAPESAVHGEPPNKERARAPDLHSDLDLDSAFSSVSGSRKQAGSVACSPAPPAEPDDGEQVPPRLSALSDEFPETFIDDDKLIELDQHLIGQLGPGYEPNRFVEFVRNRKVNGGKFRTGLLFDLAEGLPSDFVKREKKLALARQAETAEEERRAAEEEERWQRMYRSREYVDSLLTNPEWRKEDLQKVCDDPEHPYRDYVHERLEAIKNAPVPEPPAPEPPKPPPDPERIASLEHEIAEIEKTLTVKMQWKDENAKRHQLRNCQRELKTLLRERQESRAAKAQGATS